MRNPILRKSTGNEWNREDINRRIPLKRNAAVIYTKNERNQKSKASISEIPRALMLQDDSLLNPLGNKCLDWTKRKYQQKKEHSFCLSKGNNNKHLGNVRRESKFSA